MVKKKTKKEVPKLENVGKICAAAFVVPLISSLAIYGVNVAYNTAFPTKKARLQTMSEDREIKTAVSTLTLSK